MKRNQFIEMLLTLPEDAEIVVQSGDDILNDYTYQDPFLEERIGYKDQKGSMWTEHSSYRAWGTTVSTKVYVIGD